MMTILVAVYGTLKRGGSNHALLSRAQLLGTESLTMITLYHLGPYPGARAEASAGIDVEVYSVTAQELLLLDALEEYVAHAPAQGMYERKQFNTRYGLAWVYLYNRSVSGCPRINQGSWPVAATSPDL